MNDRQHLHTHNRHTHTHTHTHNLLIVSTISMLINEPVQQYAYITSRKVICNLIQSNYLTDGVIELFQLSSLP